MKEESCLLDVMVRHEGEILEEWLRQQRAVGGAQAGADEASARALLAAVAQGLQRNGSVDIREPEWDAARDLLARVAALNARRGSGLAATANYVLSLKYVLFARLRSVLPEARVVADEMWRATMLLDALCLFALESWRTAQPGAAAA